MVFSKPIKPPLAFAARNSYITFVALKCFDISLFLLVFV